MIGFSESLLKTAFDLSASHSHSHNDLSFPSRLQHLGYMELLILILNLDLDPWVDPSICSAQS